MMRPIKYLLLVSSVFASLAEANPLIGKWSANCVEFYSTVNPEIIDYSSVTIEFSGSDYRVEFTPYTTKECKVSIGKKSVRVGTYKIGKNVAGKNGVVYTEITKREKDIDAPESTSLESTGIFRVEGDQLITGKLPSGDPNAAIYKKQNI